MFSLFCDKPDLVRLFLILMLPLLSTMMNIFGLWWIVVLLAVQYEYKSDIYQDRHCHCVLCNPSNTSQSTTHNDIDHAPVLPS